MAWGVGAVWLLITASTLPGCGSSERPPAAASNEVFPGGESTAIDDRWASVVLDATQRAEVREILGEAAEDPGEVRPLRPAAFGVRFEDIPNAMLNAAPKVEMAILRSEHLDPSIEFDIRDSKGRSVEIAVRCRPRGPLASIDYRVPGADVARERAELLDAVTRVLAERPNPSDPEELAGPITQVLAEHGARVLGHQTSPERYRYTMLMLDEQEAVIEIRREPAPAIVSWTATAGTFPRPEIARGLGETFMECLRAWGEVPAPSAEE